MHSAHTGCKTRLHIGLWCIWTVNGVQQPHDQRKLIPPCCNAFNTQLWCISATPIRANSLLVLIMRFCAFGSVVVMQLYMYRPNQNQVVSSISLGFNMSHSIKLRKISTEFLEKWKTLKHIKSINFDKVIKTKFHYLEIK